MISNLIEYLYDIKVNNIFERIDYYLVYDLNGIYIFKEYLGDRDFLYFIYDFLRDKYTYYHSLIKNKNGDILSFYDGSYYIFMKVNIAFNRDINIFDLFSNRNLFIMFNSKLNWQDLWIKKVEQLYYFISNNDYGDDVLSIINYYYELSELSIEYCIKYNINLFVNFCLCHKRINCDMDLYNYFSIDNLVVDYYIRDLGEYIKDSVINGKSGEIDLNFINDLSTEDCNILISRILFPSYFYDMFEKYISEKISEREFLLYFSNIDKYEKDFCYLINQIKKRV